MHSQKLTMYTIKRIVADTLGSTRFHEGNIKRISWQVGSQSSHNNDEMKGNPSNASQWIMSVAIAIHIRSTATLLKRVCRASHGSQYKDEGSISNLKYRTHYAQAQLAISPPSNHEICGEE